MIVNVLLLILGFVLLIKGADIFVDGASSTARNFKLSKIVIGLTIVAFGTSAPELAVSIKSLLSGNNDIVFGNVLGSNVVNVLLIIGLCSVINPLKVKNNTIKKEMPISLLISCLFIVLLSDTLFDPSEIVKFTRSDAIIVILFFTVFIYYLVSIIKNKMSNVVFDEKPKYNIKKSIIFTILGLIGVIFGSDLVVDNAVSIATSLGISERIIGLTIIAVGTSLPELATSITAVVKKEEEILIGNIVGSNIFNICIVLGLPILLFGGIVPSSFTSIDLIMFAVSSIVLYIFSTTNNQINRREGIIMIISFVAYYIYLFLS